MYNNLTVVPTSSVHIVSSVTASYV